MNEVMRHVSERYRVTADPAATGIGGTSAGAIAALYVLLNGSDLFGIGLIESATLPFGQRSDAARYRVLRREVLIGST